MHPPMFLILFIYLFIYLFFALLFMVFFVCATIISIKGIIQQCFHFKKSELHAISISVFEFNKV